MEFESERCWLTRLTLKSARSREGKKNQNLIGFGPEKAEVEGSAPKEWENIKGQPVSAGKT